jgi:hypothetical protein
MMDIVSPKEYSCSARLVLVFVRVMQLSHIGCTCGGFGGTVRCVVQEPIFVGESN